MNELEQFLFEPAEKAVDPEQLRLLGKKAANAFLSEQVPLNESIRDFSKEASLNEDQMRRVVEHANTATFLGVFKGGYDTNISFPLADYNEIDSSSEPVEKTAHVQIAAKPQYIPGQEYVSLDDVFASEDLTKEASDEGWTAQDMHEYFDVRQRVKQSSSDLEQLANAFEIKVDRLSHAMDCMIKEGSHSLDVVLLVKEAGVDENLMEILLEKVSGTTMSAIRKHKREKRELAAAAEIAKDPGLQKEWEKYEALERKYKESKKEMGVKSPFVIAQVTKRHGPKAEFLRKRIKEKTAAGPEKTKAFDDHPGLKGGQKTKLPDKVQAAILKKKLLKKKVASAREVNTDHPLYKEAKSLAELTNNIILSRSDLSELVATADTKRNNDLRILAEKVL